MIGDDPLNSQPHNNTSSTRHTTELNHQQSREIEQHHARTNGGGLNYYHPHPTIAGRQLAHQAAGEVGRVASVFYQAAAGAWKEQKQRQRQTYYPAPPTGASFLINDFGIPTTNEDDDGDAMMEYTSLAEQQQRNNSPSRRQPLPREASNDDAFVYLPNFRFRPPAEGWGAVANLDLYFSSLYTYFYHRGLVPIVGRGVVELVTLAFTLVLSVFLFMYVDWPALASCKDEATCRPTFSAYLIHRPFARLSVWTFLMVMYCLIFLAYTVLATLSFMHTIQEALQAKWVFEERLGISSRRLEGGAVDWDRDVVQKLVELQQSGEYRVAIHGQDLDALVIAQRILRKENFLVALFNRGVLDLSVPVVGNQMFCSSLEVAYDIVTSVANCEPMFWSLSTKSRSSSAY
jgi:hypothetical protein